MPALPFVSGPSANALLSDLRPTTLTGPALDYVNEFLDELLVSLITAAQSINPTHLRTRGVPAVFAPLDRDSGTDSNGTPQGHSAVGALGHSAVGEAEVEIRGWYESHPTAQKGVSGFPPSGTGSGVLASHCGKDKSKSTLSSPDASSAAFPVSQAVELMRVKVAMLSTFSPQTPTDDSIDHIVDIWRDVGGDIADETISPAGLWITAVLEYVVEHVLSKLSQVVARDSSVTAAGIQDLYTAFCEDYDVYGFFKHMNVRNLLETEIRAETKRRRPQRTASQSAVPRAQSPAGPTTTGSIGSPHASKTSLASTTPGDHRKSMVSTTSRPSSEQFKASSSKTSTPTHSSHKRTTSVLSISIKQPTSEAPDPFAKRFSTDKAEEDFDAFLRSGETMRVSLTPSRFSTFDSPASNRSYETGNRTANSLSVPPSLSETSLHLSSTQASTAESGRMGINYRQVAGRSWSSASKLLPRDAAIEEREEEENLERPSLMELIKKEKRIIEQTPPRERTVPAVILGSPPSPDADADADPDTPATARSELPLRSASLLVGGDVMSEPGDSPRALPRSMRSASEGAPDLPSTGSFRLNISRSDRLDIQRETREMAAFFSAPAAIRTPAQFDDRNQRHRMPSFKNIMSRMKMDKSSKHPEKQRLNTSSSAQTLRSSTSSTQGLLRTQKSASSFASGSTVQALGVSTNSLNGSADSARVVSPPPSEASPAAPVKPREVLRKPSLVRKWAAQVTTGGEQRTLGRRRSTPRNLRGGLPPVGGEDDDPQSKSRGSQLNGGASNGSTTSHQRSVSVSNTSTSSHRQSVSSRGLGLGGVDFPEAFGFTPLDEGAEGEGGPGAALAQLTAGSKSNSPSASRVDLDSARVSPKNTEFRFNTGRRDSASPRHSPRPRSSPLHHRVAELAREGDDNAASVPPPSALSAPNPSSPEISSGLGGSSLADSVASDTYVSADEMEELEDEHMDKPEEHYASEPGASTTTQTTPDLTTIDTPELVSSSRAPTITAPAPVQPEGYVAVSDLVPLRRLLDHATSTRECQLLLDAILSQFGVPRSEHGSTVARPEDRVAAWLLAGREGPVGDGRPMGPRQPRKSGTLQHRRHASLSSQSTMKSLPALSRGRTSPIVDYERSGSDGESISAKHPLDIHAEAEAEAFAAAVAADNLARRTSQMTQ